MRNWIERHQHPASQVLHALGIPLSFVATVILAVQGHPWWAAGAFVGGYALQFIGHAIEGNDAGEVILVKKLLGKPYIAVAARSQRDNGDEDL